MVVPSLPVTPGSDAGSDAGAGTGGQFAAHAAVQVDALVLSLAKSYTVRPRASTRIVPSDVGWALTVAPLAVGVGAAGAAPEELLQPAAVSATAATARPITPTWRPLGRIVSGFRYVIIAGSPSVEWSCVHGGCAMPGCASRARAIPYGSPPAPTRRACAG